MHPSTHHIIQMAYLETNGNTFHIKGEPEFYRKIKIFLIVGFFQAFFYQIERSSYCNFTVIVFMQTTLYFMYLLLITLQPKSKAGLLSLRMFAEAMKVTAIYDKYNINAYLMGAGLSVATEYRGLGIAIELLKAR